MPLLITHFLIHSPHPPLWTNINSLPWLFLRPSLYIKLQWFSSSHYLTRDNIYWENNPSQRRPSTSDKPISHRRQNSQFICSELCPGDHVFFLSLSLSPSVNPPCSVLYSSKFQCLYFKVFVQVLCFAFVCVSMFFSNFSKHWWVL